MAPVKVKEGGRYPVGPAQIEVDCVELVPFASVTEADVRPVGRKGPGVPRAGGPPTRAPSPKTRCVYRVEFHLADALNGPPETRWCRERRREVRSRGWIEDGYFGEHVAARYDESTAAMSEPGVVESAVGLLAAAGRRRPGPGAGHRDRAYRLPLARRGVPVHGIDLSRAMVARLRAKPGGDAIGVTIGDFATTTAGGTFSVAYLVFNTIMNLTTQEAQVACFRNAAAHLEPGGCFVIEVAVPELRKLPPGQNVVPFQVSPERGPSTSTTPPRRR